jgi:hypothetical protein
VKAWKRGTFVRAVPTTDDEAKEQCLNARRTAIMLGWCPSCGELVDIDMGKLHDRWCPDATIEQRRAS